MAMPIKDLTLKEDEDVRLHPLAPKQPARILVVGGGETGKSTTMIPFILQWLISDFLFVYAKYIDAPLYQRFKEEVEKMEEKLGEGPRSLWSNSLDDYVPPGDLPDGFKSTYLFDDMINSSNKEKSKTMGEMMTGGRHKGVTVISIVQAYKNGVPAVARASASQLALFKFIKIDDLKAIYDEQSLGDITFKKFVELYNKATEHQRGFLWIDKFAKFPPFTKYRMQFDHLYDPNSRDLFVPPPRTVEQWPAFIAHLQGKDKDPTKSLKGSGLMASVDTRFKVLVGEIMAGNDSVLLKHQLAEMLKVMVSAGSISMEKANEIWKNCYCK